MSQAASQERAVSADDIFGAPIRRDDEPYESDEDLIQRATTAYVRSGVIDQPSASGSTVVRTPGSTIVELANVNGILARYKVGKSGRLTRLVS